MDPPDTPTTPAAPQELPPSAFSEIANGPPSPTPSAAPGTRTGGAGLMRQLSLLPAGCQPWNTNVCAASQTRFAYCSTLAIYIFRQKDFVLDHIIAQHDRTIMGLCWNPFNNDQLASCSLDSRLCLWDAPTQRLVASCELTSPPTFVAWAPHDKDVISCACDGGIVVLWNFAQNKMTLIKDFSGVNISVLRWNARSMHRFAIGQMNGAVSVYEKGRKSRKGLFKSDVVEQYVMDLRWDPLSDNYLLVAYRKGAIVLYDVDSQSMVTTFDRPGGGVRSICWMPTVPGGFLSTEERTGVIHIWNASQKAPLEHIQVRKSGFQSLTLAAGQDRAVCTFRDGAVGVYHLRKRRWEFMGEVGHTETIFDCDFRPSNPNQLATASYDGTVKLWNISNMSNIESLPGHNGVVYALSWAPGDDPRLATAVSTGAIFIWDVDSGRVLTRMHHHRQAVYRLNWNKLSPDLISAGSLDGTCSIFSPAGDVVKIVKHPRAVFGCTWNPFQKNQWATGCLDSIVRVFELGTETPIKMLRGHGARVFNVAWSPLVPNLLMSGSDDRTIRVWDLGQGTDRVLRGHKHNVRALVWSTEIPYLALSGSWDGTIRVWDVRQNEAIQVIHDHHADVYGLACHPRRPFIFASSSRDTSLRIWTLEDLVAPLKLRMVAGEYGEVTSSDAAAIFNTSPENPLHTRLCGWASNELCTALAGEKPGKPDAPPVHLLQVFGFVTTPDGPQELVDLVRSTVLNTQSSLTNRVPAAKDVVAFYEARAKDLEAVKVTRFVTSRVGGQKRENMLEAAAEMYLKIGNPLRYCEILLELGRWERALAVAPSVSIEYWRELSARYAQHLAGNDSAEASTFFLASGHVDDAIQFHLSRGEMDEAFVMSKLGVDGGYDELLRAVHARPSEDRVQHVPPSTLHRVVSQLAFKHFRRARSVLGASCFVSIGQHDRAILMLLQGNEVDLATTLARVLPANNAALAFEAMARRCERHGMHEMAIDILKISPDNARDLKMLCARFDGTDADLRHLYLRAGLKSPAEFCEAAAAAEAKKDYLEALVLYIVGRKTDKALSLGLGVVKLLMGKDTYDTARVAEFLSLLTNLPESALRKAEFRVELLTFSAYIGSLLAMYRGYHQIVPGMVRTTRSLAAKLSADHVVNTSLPALALQAANLMFHKAPRKAQALLDLVTKAPNAPAPVKSAAELLQKRIQGRGAGAGADGDGDGDGPTNEIIVTASNLPSGLSKMQVGSVVSGAPIHGPRYELADGTAIGLAEAIMWAKVNRFSPTCLGELINPF